MGLVEKNGQIEKLKKDKENTIILILNNKYKRNWQTPESVIEFIKNNWTKTNDVLNYEVYEWSKEYE